MKTRRVCATCNTQVIKETKIKEYPFVCLRCDENMFYIETIPVRKLKNK